MLEYSLIKQHQPRFNVRLRDDKSYPFLAVTLDDEWPRAMVMRGRKRKGVRYFGPYGHAYAIRETLDLLLRTFPIRTCSDSKLLDPPAARSTVPALPHREVRGPVRRRDRQGGLRPARRRAARASSTATPRPTVRRLDRRHARGRGGARVRAGGPAARPADERARRRSRASRWSADRNEDLDVVGIADDDLEAAVQVFYVRQGPRRRPQGLRRRQGRGPDARRASSLGSSRASTARSRRSACPSRCSSRNRPRAARPVRGVADDDAGLARRRAGAAARRQAGAARDRHPEREGGVHAPPAEARRPITTAGRGR